MRPTRAHNSLQASQIKAFPLNPPLTSIPNFIKPQYGLGLGRALALSSATLGGAVSGWTRVLVGLGEKLEFRDIWERGNEAAGRRAENRP